jgi:hypothetical protein
MSARASHMTRTTALLVAAVLVAATALVVLLRGTTATGSPPGGALAQISNEGQPIALGAGQQHEADNVGGVAAARLATRAGRTFYRLLRPDGTVCYAVDVVGGDHVGNTDCPEPATIFPTATTPILDFTIFESTSHVPGAEHVLSAQGFAADGVKSIALLDRSGRVVAQDRTSGNVYAVDVPAGRVATTVVAYDAKHAEVYRLP